MKLTRAISSNKETVSLTFADGLAGILAWAEVLNGTGLRTGKVRVESARASSDGSTLDFEVFVHEPAPPYRQLPDEAKHVDAHSLHALLSRHENAVFQTSMNGSSLSGLGFVRRSAT